MIKINKYLLTDLFKSTPKNIKITVSAIFLLSFLYFANYIIITPKWIEYRRSDKSTLFIDIKSIQFQNSGLISFNKLLNIKSSFSAKSFLVPMEVNCHNKLFRATGPVMSFSKEFAEGEKISSILPTNKDYITSEESEFSKTELQIICK